MFTEDVRLGVVMVPARLSCFLSPPASDSTREGRGAHSDSDNVVLANVTQKVFDSKSCSAECRPARMHHPLRTLLAVLVLFLFFLFTVLASGKFFQ